MRRRSRSRNRQQQQPQPSPPRNKKQPSRSRSRRRSPPGKRRVQNLAESNSPEREQKLSPIRKNQSPVRNRSPSAASNKSASKPSKPAKQGEMVDVTFEMRPFGMGPSKDSSVRGYIVEKIAEDKPADKAGVQQGWKVVAIGGKSCADADSKDIQDLLKNADLPVLVKFEQPSLQLDTDSDEDELLAQRAETRNQHAAALQNIDELSVIREPDNLPEPIKNWQDACDRKFLNVSLVQKLQGAGLKRPTLIQRHAIPILSHGPETYDMIAQAQTGSGKTFAFVIPIISRLVLKGAAPRPFFPGACSQVSPLVLVLSPTRELALQTSQEISILVKGTSLSHMAIFGGESNADTLKRVEKSQIDIVCGTPGRLVTLNDQAKLSFSYIQSVVLDEADQMLENRLEFICETILTTRDMPTPQMGRQTLLFSATMPQKIRELCPAFLREARQANLTIGNYGAGQGGSCESIKQIVRWVEDDSQRTQALLRDLHTYWLQKGKKGRVVIFSNMRVTADKLAQSLQREGLSCQHLHGKLDQEVRTEVFDKFRRGLFDILVATNLASRGLDFPDIALVVQFNVHEDIDIYTHRVGRTGRAGQVGCALSYVSYKDKRLFPKLVEFLEMNKQDVPSFLTDRPNDRGGKGGRKGDERGGGKGDDRGGGKGDGDRGYGRDNRGDDRGGYGGRRY